GTETESGTETAVEGSTIPLSEGLLTEVERIGDRLGTQVVARDVKSGIEEVIETEAVTENTELENATENAEENSEVKFGENGEFVGVSLEKSLSDFCDVLEETMKPFCAQGLMHIAEVKEDPLGRGLQIQIAIVDAETPGTEGVKTSLKSVILEDNTQIRDAIRKVAGKDSIGDQIYYCICRNWKSNLVLDPTLTKQAIQIARQSVAPIKKEYQVSQRIVQTQVDGDKLVGMHLTEEMVKLLSIENEKWLATRSWEDKLSYGVAVSLVLLLALVPIWIYIVMVEPRIIQEISRQIFVLVFCFLTLVASVWVAQLQSLPRGTVLFPLVLFSQIVTVQYNRRLGILFCGMLLLCLCVALQMTQLEVLCSAGILLTAILPLDRPRGRMQFVRVAIWATITAFLFFSAADLMMGMPLSLKVFSSALVNSLPLLLAGLVIQSLLPVLERYFGILSDVRLLELCDVSNPLLNELITRAPSTYSHSIALGTIGENAADAIHANGLLVRTAAYYHDVGKIYKPNYYAENLIVKEESPHNTLEPTMSALIIIAHVKNGVDLARLYKLPTQIVDLIEQHHGSTLVAYFYNLAKNRRALDPSIPDVEESCFRYPCPKPQTKEAVVLMLADACESACRALVEPTPARIQFLVRKISQERLEDEQFDESGITLTELRTVEDRIVKGLISYHHGRIKYPERIKEVKK
ncbi:MAG: HDIG domain-containing protein, partial [Planctomycetia bacterium]|nr:HDIG domain-containing protein [Planctomycetia bacterium]